RAWLERWLVTALIIAFCLAAFWVSTTFKKMPPILKRGIQPSDFPQLLLILLIGLTVAMAWFDPIRVRERLHGTTVKTMGLFVLFPLLTAVDLFLALGVFAAALTAIWGERRIQILALVGLVVPVLIFFLFDQVFEIRFPRGLLTNLWYG
ncbi:MAG: tripartite tricarboxylate transporter TctB family protein, partial [Pseudomonadota bacterium]